MISTFLRLGEERIITLLQLGNTCGMGNNVTLLCPWNTAHPCQYFYDQEHP